jgi:uncharacterized protein
MSDMHDTTTATEGLAPGVFPTILTEPNADDSTRPFWEAAVEGRLVAPRCVACGTFRLPPPPFCFVCRAREVEWVELPGTGTVYSFTIVRHPLAQMLAPVVPYAAGIVELDGTQGAGARMIVNIVDCDPEALRIGDRVEVVWEPVNEHMAVPRFRPVGGDA